MAKIVTNNGVIRFKPKVLYLGIKQINRDLAFDNLKIISNILKKKQIHWGPIFGTLLGIVRENNFIEWDEDIDLYILEEEEDIFKNCLFEMMDAGFEIIRYERRGLYSIIRNGEYIDFYVLRKISPELRHGGGWEFIFDKYVTDTIIRDFKGIQLEIPRDYDEFLTFHYGDWRTPIRWADFEMPYWKRLFVKCQFFIKNNLPDCLYYHMLIKHHEKDLENFKIKCKKKGVEISNDVKLNYDSRRK